MATYNMKSVRVIKIPTPKVLNKSLGSVNSMCVVNNDAYVLRGGGGSSDGVMYPMAIVKVANFAKNASIAATIPITKNGKPVRAARHSNAITYANKYFYISTMNNADEPQLLKVNSSGAIKKEYRYMKNGALAKFHNCTYFGKVNGKDTFIVGLGRSNGRAVFEFACKEGTNLVYMGKTFYSHSFASNIVSNSTYYDQSKKKFYITLFEHLGSKLVKVSYIYNYRIGSIDEIQNGQQLTVANEFICKAPSKYRQYEIEGLGLSGSTKYVVANCKSDTSSDVSDAMFVLKKS